MSEEPTTPLPEADPPPPAAEPPAPRWVRVHYIPPRTIPLPVEHAGRWWHGNSTHTLSAEAAAPLLELPGFTLLADTKSPGG